MVRSFARFRFVPLAVMLTTTVIPVRAESLLEQLQKEIAAIAQRTRSAVVSIEDDRVVNGIEPFNDLVAGHPALLNAMGLTPKSAEEYARAMQFESAKKMLEGTISRAVEKRETIEDELREMLQKYSENHPQTKGKREQLNAQDQRIADYKKQLYDLLQHNAAVRDTSAIDAFGSMVRYAGPKSGTGFSLGEGYVVTTADVLEDMKSPLIVTDTGTRVKGQVVGINNELNVGVVRLIGKAELPALTLGHSSTVEAGHFAISVGNQTGQANSVTLMLVGGLRKEGTSTGKRYYPQLIQIAGTVGAGNSGAPLVNARGEVIGMMAAVPGAARYYSYIAKDARLGYAPPIRSQNLGVGRVTGTYSKTSPPPTETYLRGSGGVLPDGSARLRSDNYLTTPATQPTVPFMKEIPIIGQLFTTSVPTYDNVTSAGFAIPIDDIKPVLEEMRAGKQVARAWIGIAPKDETRAIEKDGIVQVERTVLIEGVFPDSPAQKAGLKPGDILLRFNDQAVSSADDVRKTSIRLRPGNVLTVQVKRVTPGENMTLKVDLTIEARPGSIKPPITAPIKDSF